MARRGRPLESANMLEYQEFRELFTGFIDRYYYLNGRRVDLIKISVPRSDDDDSARAAYLNKLAERHPRHCYYCGGPITKNAPNVEPDAWRPAIHGRCMAEKAAVSEAAA
jgi:hypothetical protein